MTRTNLRVTGVALRAGKLLLIHRLRQGDEYWVFPGGGVEEGESWEQALRREMREETGLELRSYRLLCDSQANPGARFYACELAPGEPVLGGPELAAQAPDNQYTLVWVAREQLARLGAIYPRLDGACPELDAYLFGEDHANQLQTR